ncbi:MAG: hypothetical protein EPN82_01070 [Bacteroidetes bacterium]|nr:MAG: hypothetical protein EPN82_01070 [Bacteroidota bacterium]
MGYKIGDLNIYLILGYSEFFNDFDSVNLNEFLNNIPSKLILEIIAHTDAQYHLSETKQNKQFEILNAWTSRFPYYIIEKINEKLHFFNKTNIIFFNNITSLKLTQHVLKYFNDSERTELTKEEELNLFKAYLYISEEWVSKYNKIKLPNLVTEENFIQVMLPMRIVYHDLFWHSDLIIQFIKSDYFFSFCEIDKNFKVYLEVFLKEMKISSWKDYLKHIIQIYVKNIQNISRPTAVIIETKDEKIFDFFNSLCLNNLDFEIDEDFIPLRNYPIIKLDEKKYLIINYNLFIDKIYNNLKYFFADLILKNECNFNDRRIKNRIDFLSLYSKNFSENKLFFPVFNYLFFRVNTKVKLNGNELLDLLGQGVPDYYMQIFNDVYIFEFKDISLSFKTKLSYDFEVIKDELINKFVHDKEGNATGIMQIINYLNRIVEGEFDKINNSSFKNLKFFPIIVVTDYSFNFTGINYFLNNLFREELKKHNIEKNLVVNDLIIINLNTLLKYQDMINGKSSLLLKSFKEYIYFIQDSKDFMKKVITFDDFFIEKFNKTHSKMPRKFIEIAKKYFPKTEKQILINK